MYNIPRMMLLQYIFDSFQMITQDPDTPYSAGYLKRAEGYIEILEAADCGSWGGYDKTNPNKRVTGNGVFDRFLTVLRKYDDACGLQPRCGATVDTLTEYFTRLNNLREVVYSGG